MVGTKRSRNKINNATSGNKSVKKLRKKDEIGNSLKSDGRPASSYKKTHNIGNRRATNLPNSYKESDVAVLFDKNYFSNFRCSMTFGRGGSKEKLKQGSAKDSKNADQVAESRPKSPSPSTSTFDPGFSSQTKNSTKIGSCKVPVSKTPKASKRSLEQSEGNSIPNKRARRTASLNAGAILTAMLEKKSPATKKPKNDVDDKRLSLTANFNTVCQSLSSPRSSIKSQTDLISSWKQKKTDSSKNKSLNKSFVDMSCSPINIEDELRRQNASTPSEHAGSSKLTVGVRNKTLEKRRSGQKVEKTKRILFEAPDFPCIDLTRSSEENSEHLAGSETQKSRKSGSGTKSGADEKPGLPVVHKHTRSPTLSSSSSATILNVDSNACVETSSKSDGNKDQRGTAKKRSECRKGHEASGDDNATSKEFPIKTNRRLASLNAKAVLAACLDTPRRHQKTRKIPEKEPPVHEGTDATNSPLNNSTAGKSKGLECSGNNPHLSSKKQNFKKQPEAALAKNSPSLDQRSGIAGEVVLPARHLPKHPGGQNSASTSGNTSKPSKSLEKKQTTGTSPSKVVIGSVHSTARSVGSYHLMPSPVVSTDTGPLIVSQQSSIYEQMRQTPRQFSSGRPPTSAMVATILPHQICLPRPTATAFQGYPASRVAGPVTSLLLPRQHFPTQSPDAGLFSFPYQNLSLLQCSGSGTSRPSVHGSFSAHQQISSPSYLTPPTATVLFGAPQPHINLQLCPPMAYGQVCRQFSPAAPSYYQTVPFPSERFQFCNSSSSPPLSLSGSSSHIFIPYSNSNRSTSTMMNLTSPPSMSPGADAQNASQGKKRSGKVRVSGGPESIFSTLGMMHGPPLTLPVCASGKSSHYNQYVRISPKKTEQSASTSNSSIQTASSVLPQPSLLSLPSAPGSSSEIPSILKFSEDIVPIRISASPDPVDFGNCRLPETKVPPVSQECPVGKVKAKKRTRTCEQKTDSIPSKRVHESKPTSDNVPKQDNIKTTPTSKAQATKGKKTASLKSETGKTSNGSVSSVDKVQTVVQNGNPLSADRGSVPVPIGKIFDQAKAACQDAKINCSPVVVMGKPLDVDGSKICTVKSSAKKGKSPVASSRLISKNKSPNNKKMGNLLFLKSRSPSRAFMKGGRKKDAKSGKKNVKLSRQKSQDEKSSALRSNGLNKKRLGGGLSTSCPKLDLSSKNSSEKASSWSWLGTSVVKPVSVQGDGTVVRRTCYPAIQHVAGDVVKVKDCVFVRSGTRKRDIPYIAKIYGLWEEGETKEMMMGVFWYYRREHIDSETVASRYLDDEVFASRHRDVVPVACIEDKCFVLPFNQYCRYRAEVSRLECGGDKSLSSRIVPPLLEASDRLSLSVSGANSSSSCNKTHITPSFGSTMSCTSSSVACSPSPNEVVGVAKEPGGVFAEKSKINIPDGILSTDNGDSKMTCNSIANSAEGPCPPACRNSVEEKTESEPSSGSLPATTVASPTAAVVEAEAAVEAVNKTEDRSTDEAIAMEVDDKELVIDEFAATPTSEVDEAVTTLTSVVSEAMEMATSVATPISAVEEAMDTIEEVLVVQKVDEESMELTTPTGDEVGNQLATGADAFQAATDELNAASETAADELNTASETAVDELNTASETAVDELNTASETAADELNTASETAADELNTASEIAADELNTASEIAADELNTASEIAADEATSPPTMQIDESTTVPTTKSDAVIMQAPEAESVVTSSALAIDDLSAAAIHEDTTTDPPPADDGITNVPIDLPSTAAGAVMTTLAIEATETNTSLTGASHEVVASPTTAADEVTTTGTAAVKDTDEPVAATDEVDPEILLEMEPTSATDDTISASANPELGVSTPEDGTTTLVDETHTGDFKSSIEVVADVVRSLINHSCGVIATRSVEAEEVVEVGASANHAKEEAVAMPELQVTSVATVSTPCQSPKVDISSSNNNDEVLPMEICQESDTDVSEIKSQPEDLSSNPGIGSELTLDIGSLKALCSKVLNLSTLTFNLQPDSSNLVGQTCPTSCASDTVTVFSTPAITSSEVLISTLSEEMKVSQVDQMSTKIPTLHCVPRLSELSSSSFGSLPKVALSPRSTEVETVGSNLTGSLTSETTPLVLKENRASPDLPQSTATTPTSCSTIKSSAPIPPDTDGTPFANVEGRSTAPRIFSLTEHLAREVDRDNVFLCRHIYDIKLRRISKNPNISLHAVQTLSSNDGIPSGGGNSGSR